MTAGQPAARHRWTSSGSAQAAATLLSSAVGNAATIASTALLVRHLGGEAFGRAALLSTMVMALSAATASGAAMYLLRSTALDCERQFADGSLAAAASWSQAAAGLATLAILTWGFVQQSRPAIEFGFAAVAVHLVVSDTLSKHRLMGHLQILPLAAATVAGALGAAVLQLVGAWTGGPTGYLAGFAAGAGIQALLSWQTCRRTLGPARIDLREGLRAIARSDFLTFVVPATVSAAIVPLAHWTVSVIAAQKSQQYAEIAILAVAMQFFNIVMFAPAVLNKIILPRTIRLHADASAASDRRRVYRGTALTIVFTAIAPLAVWWLAAPIGSLYSFADPDAALGVILVISVGAVVACASIPVSNYLVMRARMVLGLMTNLFWFALYVGLSIALPGGSAAVGWALVTAHVCNLALALLLIHFIDKSDVAR